MADRWTSAERTEDIRVAMMKLSDLFSPSFGGQVIFRLFGPYEGIPNLMFTVNNSTIFFDSSNNLNQLMPQDFSERLGDVGYNYDYIEGLGAGFVRMMEQTTCGSARIETTITALLVALLAVYKS
jgi:hypothetical protein